MAVTTKHRLLEIVLAGALFGLAGDLCCLAIMRHSIAWDLALVQQFALATLAGSLAGSLAWWAGRGGADAPAWRVALIGLATVIAAYPAWVFLIGLRVGVTYGPAVLVVYSVPLLPDLGEVHPPGWPGDGVPRPHPRNALPAPGAALQPRPGRRRAAAGRPPVPARPGVGRAGRKRPARPGRGIMVQHPLIQNKQEADLPDPIPESTRVFDHPKGIAS